MLEVCIDSFESAEAVVKGGGHRIELCSALSEGGLTPTVGLLKAVKKHFPQTPVYAMLRPNSKISYQLTDNDMETLITDMAILRDNGADGFVFGALTSQRDIDTEKCKQIIKNANGLPVTFHRAFDMTIPAKSFENLVNIVDCGFARILTSGFAETAELGVEALVTLQRYISEKQLNIILMPGCGINIQNANQILQKTACKEFHASAKCRLVVQIPSSDSDSNAISDCIRMNSISITDANTVEQLVSIGKNFLAEAGTCHIHL